MGKYGDIYRSLFGKGKEWRWKKSRKREDKVVKKSKKTARSPDKEAGKDENELEGLGREIKERFKMVY